MSKIKKRLKKIPPGFLFSPGGLFLILFAGLMELADIFIPGGSLTFEIIPEIIFIILLRVITKMPLKNMLFPLILERIPMLSDIIPSWLIRLFA